LDIIFRYNILPRNFPPL
ncbi:unnamed protein product, partial [Allacma fusca]